MCGINGFISLGHSRSTVNEEELRPKLQLMNDTIVHRGPDSEGIFIKDRIGFGFRRLSIIDLRTEADQPMISNDGEVVLVFNGEIYNYIEVREKLRNKGYQFRTDSDTEVIINAYLEYGDECVHQFNGMWAFALYDFRKNRLFCSRDRMGVKPFYYYLKGDELYFSSELKALHAVCGLKRANLNKVYEYLAYGYRVNDGETFFEGCSELLPGTNMICEDDKIYHDKYWTLREDMYKHDQGLDYHEEFSQLFESAVRIRYRSDVPVALLLSGGLDSSAIARVTDDLIQKGGLEQNEIHAFIASFPGFKDDETPIAREFVQTCKHIKLHEMLIDSRSILDDFEKLVYGLDHPLFSFTSIAHNNIMRACNERNIKVVINGQGSDEAYAGYDRYISGAYLLDQLISKKGRFREEFQLLNQHNHYSKPFLVAQMVKSMLSPSYSSYLRARYQEKSIAKLEKAFVRNGYTHYKPEYKFSVRGNNFSKYLLDKINHQGLNTILHYEDISSMNQSIEIRSPFMDYRVMEFAFSIPNDLKFKHGRTKIIIRDTVGKRLPDSITKNRRKIGFNTPFIDTMTKDAHFKSYVADVLASQSFQTKKIWNGKKLKKVFGQAQNHPEFPFWRVINLEIWSRVYGISNL